MLVGISEQASCMYLGYHEKLTGYAVVRVVVRIVSLFVLMMRGICYHFSNKLTRASVF